MATTRNLHKLNSFYSLIIILAALVVIITGCQKDSSIAPHGSATADETYPFFIENLRKKDFGGSKINIIRTLEENDIFYRYLIAYKSDGLKITGMMNVPRGNGPFPVVILNHGHYDPKKFSVGLGFKDAADIFARNGYVAVGSDFRNHGGSDKGDGEGTIYDVIYLVEAVKKLPYVNGQRMGMWGYSGGGPLTLKAAVIKGDIKVIAVFGSMSSNESDNYYAMAKWHPEVLESVNRIIGSPDERPENYAKLSPINYFRDVSTKIIIHHGEEDRAVPLEWSEKINKTLIKEGKTVEFYTYPGQGHVLQGKAWDKAMERTVKFFNRYLKTDK